MQTILGAGGAIGRILAAELKTYTNNIRLVSRNPKAINPTDELMKADLTDAKQLDLAIAGSEVVYLVVGLEYKIKVWRVQWPAIMQNVINSCKKHKAKLVFFDNVYMYDRDFMGNMTEDTPVRPTSKKGEVRASLDSMLKKEILNGELTALISRSADFIGPDNSVLTEMVYKNFRKGKKANWFSRTDKIHSFTNTHDAARGTAKLGNAPDAYGQVWHLPTSDVRLTGKDWINLFAQEMKVKPEFSTVPKWMVGIVGLFVPVMKELKEMTYQFDRDYFFNSDKFNKRFGYIPVSPEKSVKELVNQLKG